MSQCLLHILLVTLLAATSLISYKATMQVLAEGDAVDYLWHLPAPATSLLTLSGGGKALRAWSAADGALLWERLLIGGRNAREHAPVRAVLLDSGVLVTAKAGDVQVQINRRHLLSANCQQLNVIWCFYSNPPSHHTLRCSACSMEVVHGAEQLERIVRRLCPCRRLQRSLSGKWRCPAWRLA